MGLELLNEGVNGHVPDDLVQVSRYAQSRRVFFLEALDALRQDDGEEPGGHELNLLHDLVQLQEGVLPHVDVGELDAEEVRLESEKLDCTQDLN